MPIYDLTYRGFKGAATRLPAWFPIAENTIRLALRNKLLLNAYRACALPALVVIVIIYFIYSLETPGRMGFRRLPEFKPENYLAFLRIQGFVAIGICALVGGQSIAGDRRGNAMELIFSRAIHRYHYVLGRFLGVVFLMLLATLLPPIAVWIADVLLSPDEYRYLRILDYPVRMSVWALVLSTSSALLILAFSAMIKRAWLGTAAFVTFMIGGMIFFNGLSIALQRTNESAAEFFRGLSFPMALLGVSRDILGVPQTVARFEISSTASWLTIIVTSVVSLAIILRRVRPIEVVS